MSEHIEKYDDEIDLLTVFEGFWKKRLLVLVVVLIGFVGAGLYGIAKHSNCPTSACVRQIGVLD